MACPRHRGPVGSFAILPCVTVLHHLDHKVYLGAANPVRRPRPLEAEPRMTGRGLAARGRLLPFDQKVPIAPLKYVSHALLTLDKSVTFLQRYSYSHLI